MLRAPSIGRTGDELVTHLTPLSAQGLGWHYALMTEPLPMLIVEDNPVDAELLDRALTQAGLPGPVHFVEDGHEAMEYLEGRGRYADRKEFPFPKVIISDLKMPRVNGLELLQWLSEHPQCCIIPTILLSSSGVSEDIKAAYQLGANTYFEKPISFDALQELIRSLKDYWTRSRLPHVHW